MHPYQNLYGNNKIGEGTIFGAFVDIGGVEFGNDCKIQAHVSIPPGWKLGNGVFVGPGARFANDKHPQAGGAWEPVGGEVGDGASIGMGALIGSGVKIGKNAVIGMGAVVTKSVPDGEVWVGNPAHNIRTP